MTKYFDKLLKIIFKNILLPISWKHEKENPFWGMRMSFEIHWISLIRIYFII
jgi:hypothetical protein